MTDNDNDNAAKLLKAISVLAQKNKVPFLVRNKIDELVDAFLEEVENAVHDLLIATDFNDYQGLDIDRDTEEEVETSIRLFPEVLSKKDKDGPGGLYPVALQCLLVGNDELHFNVNAVSFVPLLARLGIELGQFEEEERGGLLVHVNEDGNNTLTFLVSTLDGIKNKDAEHHQLVDDRFLTVMKKLREMNLLKKEDIREHYLLAYMASGTGEFFTERRFQYLAEWDPAALAHPHNAMSDCLPLQFASICPSIQTFRMVFKAGMSYFPKKKGISLLFHKDNGGRTPFKLACKRHGKEKAIEVIEEVLADCSNTPYNTAHALISTAIDDDIDLDGVFFLLRREPDVLQKLLFPAAGSDNTNDNNNNDNKGNYNLIPLL